jgi:parvulin-like peptidyl-prolyl isomerase
VKRSFFLVVAAVVLVLVGTACGDLAKPYAAKVNGSRIDQSIVDRELRAVLANKAVLQQLEAGLQPGEQITGAGKGDSTVSSAFAARMLTRRIYLQLIHQEIGRRHITITTAQLAQGRRDAEQQFGDAKVFAKFPKPYQDEMARSNAEVAVMQEKTVGPVTDEQLQAYYQQNAQQFSGRCISHILVPTKEKAEQLHTLLATGADFATVARAESTDTQSGAQGGFLGCYQPNEPLGFVEPFQSEAQKLPVGQISQPVQTQFGFHLIKVSSQRSFDEVKEQIRAQLQQQGSQGAFNQLLLGLVQKAKIEINPRFGRFSKEQPIGVIPPQAPQLAPTTTTANPLSGNTPQG